MKSTTFYKKKLIDLDIFQRSLTPEQAKIYEPRINLIRNIASKQALLRSRDTPFIPVLGTTSPKKDKSKKEHTEDVFRSYTAYLSNIKSNAKELPIEVIQKARMAKASAIYHDDGFAKANQYLEQQGIDYNIDKGLSTDFSLVLTKKTEVQGAIPDDIVIAYRGTKYNNFQDMVTNAGVLTGSVKRTPQSKSASKQMEQVIEKYGKTPSELIGFSKGSVHSINLGEEFNIRTTNFNPFIGPGMIDVTAGGNHEVYTTVGDGPSIGIAAKKQAPNFKVTVTEPHNDSILPNKIHSIDNFTMAQPRQSEEVRTERIKIASKSARRLADAESIVKIHNFMNGKVKQSHKDFINVDSEKGAFSFRDKIKNIAKGGINIGNNLVQRFGSKPSKDTLGDEIRAREKNIFSDERSRLLDDFEDSSSIFDIEPGTSTEMTEVPQSGGEMAEDSYFRNIMGDGNDLDLQLPEMMGPSTTVVDGPVSVPLVEGAKTTYFEPPETDDNVGDIFGEMVDEAPLQGEFMLDYNDASQMRDLEYRLNLVQMDSDTTTPLEDMWLSDNSDLVREANIPSESTPLLRNRVAVGSRRTFTDYIHSLEAGGTNVLENGTIQLNGDGFKQQRFLWKESGGDFTSAENTHFDKFPMSETQETFLEPNEIARLQSSTFQGRNEILGNMSSEVKTSMENVHGSTISAKPSSFGKSVRNFGTSSIVGIGAQYAVDKGLDAFDPQHKIQEDERQGISGFLGGGLGEMGILRLSGMAITAESVLPVAIGAGVGAVVGYETNKWFQENAPDQVYLRDISSNMAGMGTAGLITGGMIGGPIGAAGGMLLGLGAGFVVGSAEYLYNKYL